MRAFMYVGFVSMAFAGFVMAADFSKASNKELIDIAGSIPPSDVPSYHAEVKNRTQEMTVKEAREFKEKIKNQEQKVFDKMKVKDFKARKEAVSKAFDEFCKDPKNECGPSHDSKSQKDAKGAKTTGKK
ncbi:DUF1104 domain-containing protein [Helicobacter sp. 23-1046]